MTRGANPAKDPHSCSICGQPLETAKRLEGADHCDACLREASYLDGGQQ